MTSLMQTDPEPEMIENKRYKHGDALFEILAELRQSGNFCDAAIKVGRQQYPIHRNILSASSPYFMALFTSHDLGNVHSEVLIPGVPPDLVRILIDFAYTNTAGITPGNVEGLLSLADQYHVTGLLKLCCEYLHKSLTCQNCLGIVKIAQFYGCQGLEKAAWRFALRYFSNIYLSSNEFLQLSIDTVERLLSCDYLNVSCEGFVFDAVCRWVEYDRPTRLVYVRKLLSTVRLGLLPSGDFKKKVKGHDLIKDCPECAPLIKKTEKILDDLDKTEEPDFDMTLPFIRPRVPHEILFVIGGWSGGLPISMVETYDTRADRWIVCKAYDVSPRAYHGVVALGCLIYVIGGFNATDCFNSCRVLDTRTQTWAEVAPMNSKRSYVSTAQLHGFIYAMGGFEGPPRSPVSAITVPRMRSTERLNPKANQWTFITPMIERRSDANATTLRGEIYICGGFNGSECLDSAEVYNPQTDQWTLLPSMGTRRSGVGVIAYNQYIFAVGGFDGDTRVPSAEKYNPLDKEWTPVPDMHNVRSNFAIEVMDDMLFVCGGFDGETTIFNVECFDFNAQEWYNATDLNLYKSALCACVVRDLEDVTDYIYKKKERTPLPDKSRREEGKEEGEGWGHVTV